jgi:pimeloyl-ACP methyl ester carboxylesterase
MPQKLELPQHVPPPGRLVDIGTCVLHVHVQGEGAPAVILEAGIAATSLSWALVESDLAACCRVVTYDRAGLGWSGPARSPRTPGVIAQELRTALQVLGVNGPFVLVGHSFGGIVVQSFARRFPAEVRGLVLLDPFDPAEWCPLSPQRKAMLDRGIRLSRRGAFLARMGVVRASLRFLLAGNQIIPRLAARLSSGHGGSSLTGRLAGEVRKLPRELWPAIAWHWCQAKNFEGMARHLESLAESAAEAADIQLEESLPVSVLLAEDGGERQFPSAWDVQRLPGSGHWVQLDRPDLVVAAVKRTIGRCAART